MTSVLEGRTWLARVAVAVAAVVALGALPDSDVGGVATVAAVWIPLISVTQWSRRRWPGALGLVPATLVDLVALVVVARVEPAVVPVVAVLLPSAGLVHARDQSPAQRAATGIAVVAAQVVAGPLDGALAALVIAVDVAAIAIGALLWGERDLERRRARAALDNADQFTQALLTGIGEAVVVTDASGRVRSSNDAAEITFGVPVAGTCTRTLGLHRGPQTLDCSHGCRLLDEDTGVGQAEVTRDHPGGARQTLLVNVRAVRSPTGRVREVVHSYRDVSRLKEAEQAKTLFLATASHELKTPIAVILGFSALLDRDETDPAASTTAIRTIQERARELSGIVDRLLLISRLDGGRHGIRTEPCRLGPVVEERCAALRTTTGRQIEVELPADVPPVDGDVATLRTIVDHLVDNAVKYSPGGEPVTVRLRAEQRHVHLDVVDRGIGMSARDIEHCFDVFWQAESNDTRRFGGSGVGLHIVRTMARALGGDVTVLASTPGRGTTFRCTLRRARPVRPGDRRTPEHAMIDELERQLGVGEDGT